MSSESASQSKMRQRAEIDGIVYPYEVDEKGDYRFLVDERACLFRQWNWGEKNRAVGAATVADPATGALNIDLACFNELLLASCLVKAEGLPEVSVEALRALPPNLGDRLLAIALWVNELSEESKKNFDGRSRAVSRTRT